MKKVWIIAAMLLATVWFDGRIVAGDAHAASVGGQCYSAASVCPSRAAGLRGRLFRSYRVQPRRQLACSNQCRRTCAAIQARCRANIAVCAARVRACLRRCGC